MSWWRGLFRRRRYDDLAVSIEEHIALRAEELMEAGMSRDDAECAARRAFGNRAVITERSREAWQWPTLESLWADVRFALRQLVKSPGFTFTAVLTLALGIAVNATMFSMVSAFLMPPLPGRDAKNIVVVTSVDPNSQFLPDTSRISPANFLSWRDDRIFAALAAEGDRSGSLSGPGQHPEQVRFEAVTANFFSLLGVTPVLGRDFVAADEQTGSNHEVMLSHGLWARRYGSDPGIVGKTIRLDREDYTVVGVMPADFRLMGFLPELWIPLSLTPQDRTEAARRDRSLWLFARLAPGVTLAQARAETSALAERAQHDFPAEEARWGAMVRTLSDFVVYNFSIRNGVVVMMTTVAFILLIACANVAGLLLTRATGRQKELAIRASLGASRSRVMRQLLTEGLVIALIGGGCGLALAAMGIRLLAAGMNFNDFIAAVPVRLDQRVLAFTVVVTLACAVLSSLAPALKASRANLTAGLQSESRTASAGPARNRLRAVLVGGEIASALFLLTGTALLIKGVYESEHQKLGFRHDHVLTAGITLDHARYDTPEKQVQFVRDLVPGLERIPGVVDVAVTSDLPATGSATQTIHLKSDADAGRAQRAGESKSAQYVAVTPDYFRVSGIALEQGRAFTGDDKTGNPPVVIVNREFVHRYLKGADALGQQVMIDGLDGGSHWSSIVGVVNDVKYVSNSPRVDPEVFEALAQRPQSAFSVMLRTTVDPVSAIPTLRHVMTEMDSDLPLVQVLSMDQIVVQQRGGDPLFEKILGSFAGLALLLATVGIYGLIAYSVRQRTQEIGIRMALGASTRDVARMVLKQGLKVAAIGCAVGLVLALPLGRLFNSMFPGFQFSAPLVYPLVLVVMAALALAATIGPARRAAHVDPSQALRSE